MLYPLAFTVGLIIAVSHQGAAMRHSAEPEVVSCSQNLNRFGVPSTRTKHTSRPREEQVALLVDRFVGAACDLIAVQEVGGDSDRRAQANLEVLTRALSARTGKPYRGLIGESNDEYIRNGVIFDSARLSMLELKSFTRHNVPKLMPMWRNERFIRGPLLVRFLVRGQGGAPERKLSIFSFHLKSKANAWKDRTKTKYEISRMQSAEALRLLAEQEVERLGKTGIVLLAGDRNSLSGSASSEMLEGDVRLFDFSAAGSCSLSAQLEPDCDVPPPGQGMFRSTLDELMNATKKKIGTYRYKGKLQAIDDIYVNSDAQWMIYDREGSVSAGVYGTFGKGSDHKLTWVVLNW